MICPRCRAYAPDDAVYCSRCGEGLQPGARPAQVVINVPGHNDDPFNRYVNQRPWLIALILIALFGVMFFMSFVERDANQQADQAIEYNKKVERQIENSFPFNR